MIFFFLSKLLFNLNSSTEIFNKNNYDASVKYLVLQSNY